MGVNIKNTAELNDGVRNQTSSSFRRSRLLVKGQEGAFRDKRNAVP